MAELVNLAETTVVKAGNAFCVALRDGRLPLATGHPLGAYLDDCRHLSGYELRLGGQAPRLLTASDAAGTAAVFELTNPDLTLADGRELPLQSLRVRVERRMLPVAMADRITVHSHAREPVELELELRLDADLRPMLEVRGMVSPTARDVRRSADGDTLTFAAVGLDGRERSTAIACPGAVASADGRLRVPVALEPGGELTLDVDFAFAEPSGRPPIAGAGAGRSDGRASLSLAGAEADAWLADRPRVAVDDELVERVLRRSLLDLRLLTSDLDGHRYYAAGVPWYATLFGRDSIVTALQLLAFDPAMATETLRLLAGRLGSRLDPERDEEPGKVLHELRLGELATAGLTPLARYYGTVDATPLFLCLLCEHADWTGSLDLFRELRPQVDAALRWIDELGDLDGDGLLEYHKRSPGGLVNQGWKDSWDGIVDEHGVPLRSPIALVEAQGYAIAAKRGMARLVELDGDAARAGELRADAERRAGALERFWLPDLGFYSMAMDADKRPSRALASNQGHLLWAEAVTPERAVAIREALMGDGAYSGWGVRTLGARERAFNPVGYHTGTIWPHDNALVAVGLRKYGHDAAFLRIFDGLLDAASRFGDHRLPELFAGFPRADYEDPVPYPVACSPQAWAAGTLPCLLVAGLGLAPDGLDRVLRIRRPTLPRQVGRLAVHGLRVGDAGVDLLFERVADSVALTDVQVDGDLDVVLELARGGQAR
ncbi:MAG TPA: glycogen debranching N-terminal domain-containing protein [Solirubrobacteraceae bacterium]|nr:glycogen debranching N-terminal domain-containing protein [Solirubrobacteraceae bacterium]